MTNNLIVSHCRPNNKNNLVVIKNAIENYLIAEGKSNKFKNNVSECRVTNGFKRFRVAIKECLV
jgi:hypothetical protein